jgi:hypothetical protein
MPDEEWVALWMRTPLREPKARKHACPLLYGEILYLPWLFHYLDIFEKRFQNKRLDDKMCRN